MSQVRAPIPDRSVPSRGGLSYPERELYEEVAFIAYHFHWSHQEIMQMEHWERRRWCEEISRINRRLSEAAQER